MCVCFFVCVYQNLIETRESLASLVSLLSHNYGYIKLNDVKVYALTREVARDTLALGWQS